FERIVADLKNPPQYRERMEVLQIAHVLLDAGFSIAFDKDVSINGGQRKPDLFITLDPSDSGRFVEVSSLLVSAKQHEADAVFYAINDMLWPLTRELDFSGHCQRVLSPVHLAEILKKIRSAADTATREGFGS